MEFGFNDARCSGPCRPSITVPTAVSRWTGLVPLITPDEPDKVYTDSPVHSGVPSTSAYMC